MANVLNKDPFSYQVDKQNFIQDLKSFHTARGCPFDRVPEVGGCEIDLYRLYRRVIDLGGWQKVNNDLLWEDIQEEFRIPLACVNGSQALKYIYFRYLNLYEKECFFGLVSDQHCNDHEDGPTRKKVCLPVDSIPTTYNYYQHKVQDAQRSAARLSTDLLKHGAYTKLELSLHCGLPNEVDFALNVCLLLSAEGHHVFNLTLSSHMISVLMAAVGVFEEGPTSLADVMQHTWQRQQSKRDFLRFWHDVIEDTEIRCLIKTKCGVYRQADPLGNKVLNLTQPCDVRNVEGQRVNQMAVLIRNLSFDEDNQKALCGSELIYRFLLLCVHCTYGCLRQLAMDIFGNIAQQMILKPLHSSNILSVMDLIKNSLVADDTFVVVGALEMLSQICQLEDNEAVVMERMTSEAYARIVQLLMVPDIRLIVHSLEALYQLSELGSACATMIAGVGHSVEIFVNLITVEAKSYGPNALMGIKVVEYIPPTDTTASASTMPLQTPPQPTGTFKQVTSASKPSVLSGQRCRSMAVSDTARRDVETTAINWLRGTFEVNNGSGLTLSELLAEYHNFCGKFGITDVIGIDDFLCIVKSAMTDISVAKVDTGGGGASDGKGVVFKGLCHRGTPQPFVILTGSDRVLNPITCSAPANLLRFSTPVSPPILSDTLLSPTTPTLRQRLMEPPKLPHQMSLLPYAGSIGAGLSHVSGKPASVATAAVTGVGSVAASATSNIAANKLPEWSSLSVRSTGLASALPVIRPVSGLVMPAVIQLQSVPHAGMFLSRTPLRFQSNAVPNFIPNVMLVQNKVSAVSAPFHFCTTSVLTSALSSSNPLLVSVSKVQPTVQLTAEHLAGKTGSCSTVHGQFLVHAHEEGISNSNYADMERGNSDDMKNLLALKLNQNLISHTSHTMLKTTSKDASQSVLKTAGPSHSISVPFSHPTSVTPNTDNVEKHHVDAAVSSFYTTGIPVRLLHPIFAGPKAATETELFSQQPTQPVYSQSTVLHQPPCCVQTTHPYHDQGHRFLAPHNVRHGMSASQQAFCFVPPPFSAQCAMDGGKSGQQTIQPQRHAVDIQMTDVSRRHQQQSCHPFLSEVNHIGDCHAAHMQTEAQQPLLSEWSNQEYRTTNLSQWSHGADANLSKCNHQEQLHASTFQSVLTVKRPLVGTVPIGEEFFEDEPEHVHCSSAVSKEASCPVRPQNMDVECQTRHNQQASGVQPSVPNVFHDDTLQSSQCQTVVQSCSMVLDPATSSSHPDQQWQVAPGAKDPVSCIAEHQVNIPQQVPVRLQLGQVVSLCQALPLPQQQMFLQQSSGQQHCPAMLVQAPVHVNVQGAQIHLAQQILQTNPHLQHIQLNLGNGQQVFLHRSCQQQMHVQRHAVSINPQLVVLPQKNSIVLQQGLPQQFFIQGQSSTQVQHVQLHPNLHSSLRMNQNRQPYVVQLPMYQIPIGGAFSSCSTTNSNIPTSIPHSSAIDTIPLLPHRTVISSMAHCLSSSSIAVTDNAATHHIVSDSLGTIGCAGDNHPLIPGTECQSVAGWNSCVNSGLHVNSRMTYLPFLPLPVCGQSLSAASSLPPAHSLEHSSPVEPSVSVASHFFNGSTQNTVSQSAEHCQFSNYRHLNGSDRPLTGKDSTAPVRAIKSTELPRFCCNHLHEIAQCPNPASHFTSRPIVAASCGTNSLLGKILWIDSVKDSASSVTNSALEKSVRLNGMVQHVVNSDSSWVSESGLLANQKPCAKSDLEKTQNILPGHQTNGFSGHMDFIEHEQTVLDAVSVGGKCLVTRQTSTEDISLDYPDSRLNLNPRTEGDLRSGAIGGKFSSTCSHQASNCSLSSHSVWLSLHSRAPFSGSGTTVSSAAAKQCDTQKSVCDARSEILSVKSRRRKISSEAESAIASAKSLRYTCEWASCIRCFKTARQVYVHVVRNHISQDAESTCLWKGCEPLKRRKWSLVTHVQDHHCSEAAQQAILQRRLHSSQNHKSAATISQMAPVYPPDAAYQAIRRFHVKPPFHEMTEVPEGPVTKHIRLTSALILRNLARFSPLEESIADRVASHCSIMVHHGFRSEEARHARKQKYQLRQTTSHSSLLVAHQVLNPITCSAPANLLRFSTPVSPPILSDTLLSPTTPTLRQRLMEPPKLPHQMSLLPYAGSIGAGLSHVSGKPASVATAAVTGVGSVAASATSNIAANKLPEWSSLSVRSTGLASALPVIRPVSGLVMPAVIQLQSVPHAGMFLSRTPLRFQSNAVPNFIPNVMLVQNKVSAVSAPFHFCTTSVLTSALSSSNPLLVSVSKVQPTVQLTAEHLAGKTGSCSTVHGQFLVHAHEEGISNSNYADMERGNSDDMKNLLALKLNQNLISHTSHTMLKTTSKDASQSVLKTAGPSHSISVPFSHPTSVTPNTDNVEKHHVDAAVSSFYTTGIPVRLLHPIFAGPKAATETELFSQQPTQPVYSQSTVLHQPPCCVQTTHPYHDQGHRFLAPHNVRHGMSASQQAFCFVPPPFSAQCAMDGGKSGQQTIQPQRHAVDIQMTDVSRRHQQQSCHPFLSEVNHIGDCHAAHMQTEAQQPLLSEWSNQEYRTTNLSQWSHGADANLSKCNHQEQLHASTFQSVLTVKRPLVGTVPIGEEFFEDEPEHVHCSSAVSKEASCPVRPQNMDVECQTRHNQQASGVQPSVPNVFHDDTVQSSQCQTVVQSCSMVLDPATSSSHPDQQWQVAPGAKDPVSCIAEHQVNIPQQVPVRLQLGQVVSLCQALPLPQQQMFLQQSSGQQHCPAMLVQAPVHVNVQGAQIHLAQQILQTNPHLQHIQLNLGNGQQVFLHRSCQQQMHVQRHAVSINPQLVVLPQKNSIVLQQGLPQQFFIQGQSSTQVQHVQLHPNLHSSLRMNQNRQPYVVQLPMYQIPIGGAFSSCSTTNSNIPTSIPHSSAIDTIPLLPHRTVISSMAHCLSSSSIAVTDNAATHHIVSDSLGTIGCAGDNHPLIPGTECQSVAGWNSCVNSGLHVNSRMTYLPFLPLPVCGQSLSAASSLPPAHSLEHSSPVEPSVSVASHFFNGSTQNTVSQSAEHCQFSNYRHLNGSDRPLTGKDSTAPVRAIKSTELPRFCCNHLHEIAQCPNPASHFTSRPIVAASCGTNSLLGKILWIDSVKDSASSVTNSALEKSVRLNGMVQHVVNSDSSWVSESGLLANQKPCAKSDLEKTQNILPGHQTNGFSGHMDFIEHEQTVLDAVSVGGKCLVTRQTSTEDISLDYPDSRLNLNPRTEGDLRSGAIGGKFSSTCSHQASNCSLSSHSVWLSLHSRAPFSGSGTTVSSAAAKQCDTQKSVCDARSEILSVKSRRRKISSEAESAIASAKSLRYTCEWASCIRCFKTARQVYVHVVRNHISQDAESTCLWKGCEPLKRRKWSLVTHVQDHHCSEAAQQAILQRRLHSSQNHKSAATISQMAPVYPPDAAYQAIRRFHVKPPFHEMTEVPEGPVTKHIRLTSALILRNLARFSPLGRSLMKRWEPALSYSALSAVESSTALANCLFEMLHDT